MEKFLPNISIIIKERILSFLEIDTFNSRLNIWELAKNIYFQYPMGVGYGNFRVAGEGAQVPLALSYLAGRSGHNSFIVTLIENSPFALVTLILIAFHSIKGIFQKINPVLFLAISVSFLAFWIHASAHTVHALLHVWVLLACLENLRKIGSAELSKRTYRQQSRV